MGKLRDTFPKISRPLEYVAFLNFKVDTKEGPAYFFLACDGYTEFAFNISVEENENPESILKSIYLLTEDPEFVKHIDKGFTLVFDRFEEISDKIESIVNTVNGKILFNKRLHKKISAPLVASFKQLLSMPYK